MTREERELTIQYLTEMQEGYIEGEGYERHPLPEWFALDYAIKAIEQTMWVSVSERLPEERGVYIVTEKMFSLNDGEHKGKFNIMTEQVEWSGEKWQRARFYEVIAWMPLPKPYVPQESEDKK